MVKKNARYLIQNALFDLLNEHPLDKIDVQDITAKSGLSRQTFYYNFKNKQDLLDWVVEENNKYALEFFNKSGAIYDFILHFMILMREHKLFYTNLVEEKDGGRSFARNFEGGIVACAEIIEGRCAIGKMNNKLWSSLHFFTYGAKGMIVNWVETGMVEEPKQLAEIIMKSMPCRVDNYFQQCS